MPLTQPASIKQPRLYATDRLVGQMPSISEHEVPSCSTCTHVTTRMRSINAWCKSAQLQPQSTFHNAPYGHIHMHNSSLSYPREHGAVHVGEGQRVHFELNELFVAGSGRLTPLHM